MDDEVVLKRSLKREDKEEDIEGVKTDIEMLAA